MNNLMTLSQQTTSTTAATDQDATVTRTTRINPPGLPTLRYQGGEYLPTVQRMLAQLTSSDALARLNPDAYDDWSIALLHAWAVVTDVLTFYQERLINEGYLGTATERRSILELARAIGYELRPGLAAQADLALTIAAADDGQPQQLTIGKGGPVQSTPKEGGSPQIFETSHAQAVRTEWNLLRPYIDLKPPATVVTPPLPIAEPSIRVAGTRSDLSVGAYILIVEQPPPATAITEEQPKRPSPAWLLGQLTAVESDPQKPYSLLTWERLDSCGEIIYRPAIYIFRQEAKLFGYAQGAVYYDQEEKLLTPTSDAPTTATPQATQPLPVAPASATSQALAGIAATDATTTPAEPAAPAKVAKWEPRTYSLPNTDINTCVINAQGWIFVGTKHDVYRSTDDGANWTVVGVDLIRRNVTALALLDNLLFAGTSTGGIYLSYDNGDNWTPISGDVVAPDVTVENKSTEFNVKYTEVLPKVPVTELAAERKDKIVILYAATAEGIFVSEDGGKSWQTKGAEAALTNRPTAAEQREQLLQAARSLLSNQALGWLTRPVETGARGIGTLKWLGLDLWDFLRTRVQRTPPTQAITALSLVPKGNQSTVVIGTETGKYDLKPGPRRWIIVVAILLLILLQQFLFNRNQFSRLQMTFAGELVAPPAQTPTAPTSQVEVALLTQGMLEVDPKFQFENSPNYQLTLNTDHILPATVDITKTQAVLSGYLPLSGTVSLAEATSALAEVHGMTTLTITGLPTATLNQITKRGAAKALLRIEAVAQLPAGGERWPPVIQSTSGTFDGEFIAAPLKDETLPWLGPIWEGIQELFQATIIPAWTTIKTFVLELWAALPASVREVLTPLYTEFIAPVVLFLDAYLVRPLLNDTAATLVQASGIILAVIALLLAWQYTARQMSERKTVRINEPVYTLVVRDSGQLFAGTDSGVYRSLENDPDLPRYKQMQRILLYQLFQDKEMEPINNGLPLKDGKGPQVRALAINSKGALLLGTADGQLFRSDDNGDQWYSYSDRLVPTPAQSATSDASAKALKAVKTIVITKQGQFVAGAVGTNPVEDQWFTNQAGVPPADQDAFYPGVVDLDANYADVTAPGWLLLRRAASSKFAFTHYPIQAVDNIISRDFATPGAYQRLTISQQATTPLTAYSRSRTTAFVGSELVPLFDNTPVAGQRIRLDRYVPGLTAGQRLMIRGQRLRGLILSTELVLATAEGLDEYPLQPNEIVQVLAGPLLHQEENEAPLTNDQLTKLHSWQLATRTGFVGKVSATLAQIRWIAPAVNDPLVSEVITIACVDPGITNSTLFLEKALAHAYDRATVSIFGNIVPVTHGETVADEVLGSGSGTQAFERFTMQESPLTYVSAPTTTGFASTLEVKVNRIVWAEAPYLYGLPRDRRAYIVRQDAADNTTITFGDGKQGARLPTGTEQITATYRIGSGPDGNVPADTINQLRNLPDAVSAATNPLPATGGLRPEAPEVARRQAPRMVRVMGRIVALTDYVDFAQQFPGIGRARSQASGIGKQRVIKLTIADSAGNEVPANAPLITNLQQAIEVNRAVTIPKVEIKSYEPRYFTVAAILRTAPDHATRDAEIKKEARRRLIAYFAFDQRDFGQAVTLAEVTAQLQAVIGVVAVVDATIAFQGEGSGNDRPATPPRQQLFAQPTELLKLNAVTGITLTCDPVAAAPTLGTLRRGAR